MIGVTRDIPVSPDTVFAVLADGWSYAGWVVGNAHVRDVDAGWPAEGTRIHHSAGAWPVHIKDVTNVRSVEPGRKLELDARLWPLGRARIRITLTPMPEGGTRVLMEEEAVKGPLAPLPTAVQALMLRPRNRESLARLSDLAVNRTNETNRTNREERTR